MHFFNPEIEEIPKYSPIFMCSRGTTTRLEYVTFFEVFNPE